MQARHDAAKELRTPGTARRLPAPVADLPCGWRYVSSLRLRKWSRAPYIIQSRVRTTKRGKISIMVISSRTIISMLRLSLRKAVRPAIRQGAAVTCHQPLAAATCFYALLDNNILLIYRISIQDPYHCIEEFLYPRNCSIMQWRTCLGRYIGKNAASRSMAKIYLTCDLQITSLSLQRRCRAYNRWWMNWLALLYVLAYGWTWTRLRSCSMNMYHRSRLRYTAPFSKLFKNICTSDRLCS